VFSGKSNIGEIAYQAYGQTTDFKNFQGNPMPKWEELPDKIKEAWMNASVKIASISSPTDTEEKQIMADAKYMPIEEFRSAGLLQEVNRIFFHPLGLALQVVKDEAGKMKLCGIIDAREDPEGFVFDPEPDNAKAEYVRNKFHERAIARLNKLGYVNQPVNSGCSISL
jgi:hypothetical protein